jgi:ribosomal protein S12 methylthiotransferase accessory factor
VDKNIAVLRAITEAAQTKLTVISGARDDLLLQHYLTSMNEGTFKNGKKPYAKCLNLQYEKSFEKNIDYLLKQLCKAGNTRVITYDHTLQSLAIPVVHSFIPGLKHETRGL